MPILDAALAFALTMLAVATLVTQTVNLGRSFLKVRQSNMRRMLEQYFREELGPVVERELKRLSGRVDPQVGDSLRASASAAAVVDAFPDAGQLAHVSTEELIERLKRTSLGSEVLEKAKEEAGAIFNELGTRWEALGNRYTESFRTDSRKVATIVALFLAAVLNIDSWFILDSYLTHRHLAASVTAQLDEIVADADAALATSDNGEPAELAALLAGLDRTRAEVDRLEAAGFPVGPDYFPHGCFEQSPPASAGCATKSNLEGWATWAMGIVLTALLAGLGAPFWYDAVAGIARVARARPQT
jgi:hypothetical protein